MITNLSYIFNSLAIAYQILVAYLAVKLVSITRSRAWMFITFAAVLIILRRIFSFIDILYFNKEVSIHLDAFAMVGSLLMSIGMVLLVPVFINMRKTDEALRESEKRYLDLYDNAPDMYFTVRPDGTVVSVNQLGAEMLGYNKEELVTQSVMKVVHPDDVSLVQHQIDEILKKRDGAVSPLKFRKIRKDGSIMHVSERVSMHIKQGGEKILRILCRDISKLVDVEDELKERKLYLENIMAFAPYAIVTQDKEGKILEWNKEAGRLFGYSYKEAIGNKLDDLITASDSNIYKEAKDITEKLLGGSSLTARETVRYRKDGSPVDVLISASPIIVGGQIIGIVSVYRDITRDKMLKRETEERRKYFEGLITSAPNAIVTTDSEHNVVEWNPEAEKLFGYSAEETIGRNIDDLITGNDPETIQNAKALTKEVLLNRKDVPPTRVIRYRKDGTPVNVIVSGSSIVVRDRLVGVIATYTDLTEYIKEEKIRESIYKIAEAVVTSKDINELFTFIHETIKGLMPAENFYIALYDPDMDLIRYPYLAYRFDKIRMQEKAENDLTSYVLHTRKPLLANARMISDLQKDEGLGSTEEQPISWLGVPLIIEGEVLGVIATQSYTKGVEYTKRDKEILQYVSYQIAQAIRYKQTEVKLIEQMRELKSFYSASLDREHKIIELKHEVNSLLDRLGEEKMYKI